MFQWEKKLTGLEIPASSVLKLYRSIGEMQIGLPGLNSGEALAYLCVFMHKGGYRVVVVFHLLSSNQLAFYVNDAGVLSEQDAARVVDDGFKFVESMGFLLSDLDMDLRSSQERETLWESLPLKAGAMARQAPSQGAELAQRAEYGAGDQEEAFAAPSNSPLAKRKIGEFDVVQLRLRESLGRMLSTF